MYYKLSEMYDLIAHAGHTLVNLAFAMPAVAFIGWLVVLHVKDRRKRD